MCLLDGFEIFSRFLVVSERTKASTQIRLIEWDNNLSYNIDFAEPAYVANVAYNPEFNTDMVRFNYQSMTTPPSVYDFDMMLKTRTLMKQQEILGGYDASQYTTERLWAYS